MNLTFRRRRRAVLATKVAVLVTGLATAVSGCGAVSLQGVPLPGGADLGSEPYEVVVQMHDVLDLVPQSSVKVNNVSVGEVRSIELNPQGWFAEVHVALNSDVRLPANASAQLRQTTLLGEKYIDLSAPKQEPPRGTLQEGSVIPLQRTNRFPEVEEIFGALSMLLNGGGIGQLQGIAQELNKALDGREDDARALLRDLNTLVTTLDAQKTSITRALDGLDRLSGTLADQRGNLDAVLTELEPGLAVLNEQRPQLVGLLEALDKLSGVATNVVEKSHDDLIADLRALRPTLRELAKTGDALPKSLEVLATPPFTDAAIKPTAGDYMNLHVSLDLNLATLLDNLLNASTVPESIPDPLSMLPAPARQLVPEVPSLPRPPSLPNLLAPPGEDQAASQPSGARPGPEPSLPVDRLPLPGLGGDR